MSNNRPEAMDRRQDRSIFSDKDEPCVWMKARVVNFKLCHRSCDCLDCAFDRAMSRAWSQEPEEGESGRGSVDEVERCQRG